MTWESDILEVVVGLNPTISGKVILNKANCTIKASTVREYKIGYRPELQGHPTQTVFFETALKGRNVQGRFDLMSVL